MIHANERGKPLKVWWSNLMIALVVIISMASCVFAQGAASATSGKTVAMNDCPDGVCRLSGGPGGQPTQGGAAALASASSGAASIPWRKLFPEGLIDTAGKPVDLAVLRSKLVGLYFSAHWCPPCKRFTPILVEFRNANRDAFEVVFISSDEDEAQKAVYIKEAAMEWLTVPWGCSAVEALADRYSVGGIPFLVILGPDGKTISETGREEVEENASGALALWKAKAGMP